MLFIEISVVWCCAFVPIFYLFFDYVVGLSDSDFFGSFFKAKVGEFKRA